MVPENIVWAFFSLSDYEHQYNVVLTKAIATGNKPISNDVYYKNIKGVWIKVLVNLVYLIN